ncbi:hypothetical protein CC78DRAFT_573929 [Lojkania enalia]|uniref:Uncharacterized protein n=1 Tax=Lojkania enalia TaxID=147567 RepID=A0A9P4TQL1_9PLEO|nr:hypothetical protein CC78DRAFT_573929 [Didymosphaeria enalia]
MVVTPVHATDETIYGTLRIKLQNECNNRKRNVVATLDDYIKRMEGSKMLQKEKVRTLAGVRGTRGRSKKRELQRRGHYSNVEEHAKVRVQGTQARLEGPGLEVEFWLERRLGGHQSECDDPRTIRPLHVSTPKAWPVRKHWDSCSAGTGARNLTKAGIRPSDCRDCTTAVRGIPARAHDLPSATKVFRAAAHEGKGMTASSDPYRLACAGRNA